MTKKNEKIADVVENATSAPTEKAVEVQELEAANVALQAEIETLRAEISKLEAKNTELEAQIFEWQALENGETATISEPEKSIEFDFRGEKYKFSDDAPKHILFGGETYTQDEVSQDEDILLHLIGGKSPLIVKQ